MNVNLHQVAYRDNHIHACDTFSNYAEYFSSTILADKRVQYCSGDFYSFSHYFSMMLRYSLLR
jgi:hypothetical protein